MSWHQTDAWLRACEKLVRTTSAKNDIVKARRYWTDAEQLTTGVAAAALFVATRSPDIAKELREFHERHLETVRDKALKKAFAAYAKDARTRRPAHRPPGSRLDDRDMSALVIARMIMLGDNPPSVAAAIRKGVEFATASQSPVDCQSPAARDRRLRYKLSAKESFLDEVLRGAGYPGL